MPATPPSVSVVIPTYNRAGTIMASIASVLAQTYSDFELIVVDDCSTDNTLELLDGIEDRRLRVVRHERNAGSSAARNTGIDAAVARYIAFQDSDDEWLATKLEKQMARMAEKGTSYVGAYCGMLIVGTQEVLLNKATTRPSVRYLPGPEVGVVEGDILSSLLKGNFISTQTLLVRRDALREIGGFDESLPPLEDWDCVITLAQKGPFAHVAEPLVIQRFSEDSITRSVPNRVAARAGIVRKHFDLISADRELLRHHYEGLGGGYLRIGKKAEARRHYLKALGLKPYRVKTWANLVRTIGS